MQNVAKYVVLSHWKHFLKLMQEILMALAIKFKTAIYAAIAAYGAATMRYWKQKRAGKKPAVKDWFLFGATAFMVTYTFFVVGTYLYPNIPQNLLLSVGFWIGYMSDYFYSWIPKYIKTKINRNDNIE